MNWFDRRHKFPISQTPRLLVMTLERRCQQLFSPTYRTIYKSRRAIQISQVSITTRSCRSLTRTLSSFGKWKFIRASFSHGINSRACVPTEHRSFSLVREREDWELSKYRFRLPLLPRIFTTPLAPGITNQNRAHLSFLFPLLFFWLSSFLAHSLSLIRAFYSHAAPGMPMARDRDSDFREL